MSWHAWTEDGYGYPLFNENNLRKILQFIAENSDYQELLDCETDYDAYDIMGQCCADTIAEIINEREQLSVVRGYTTCGDTNQDECLGIEPVYPWSMNENDKKLTKEKANQILVKYANILGITEPPEYFEANYCG